MKMFYYKMMASFFLSQQTTEAMSSVSPFEVALNLATQPTVNLRVAEKRLTVDSTLPPC